MREVTQTVYVGDDGNPYATESAARRADSIHAVDTALNEYDVDWRELTAEKIADALYAAGYIIHKVFAAAPTA